MTGEALVYVLDIPYHADKAYSYFIPELIKDEAAVGYAVEIPFGRGNRRMTGIIVEIREKEPPKGTKPITALVSDSPVLDEEQLGLCRFVKEYTLCTFSEALRAIIPSAAISRIITYYRLTDKPRPSSLDERSKQILRVAEGKKRFSRQTLQAELGINVVNTLATLEKNGYVEKVTELRESGNIRLTHYAELTDALMREMKYDGDALARETAALRGVNQKKLLEAIAAGGKLSYEEMSSGCGISRAAVKAALSVLASRSLVRLSEEEEYRNSYSFDEVIKRRGENICRMKPALTEEQRAAAGTVSAMLAAGKPAAALLHGVTGSGKTNVIMEAIDACLDGGRGAIMLIPEIALTPQTVGLFAARYGDKIAVIHSSLSAGERYDAWRRIKTGEAPVVIGTRSAVFAPLPKIGLIVIDEEQEYTYKSDTNPKYKAHDIARKRCADHNAVMLLASATPSVTSYYKAVTGAYTLIELKNRYGGRPLPNVDIVDMRGETSSGNITPVSERLRARLYEDKEEGNQSILFLNRRGYSNYVSCRSCGKSLKCPNCSVTLTYHATKKHFAPKTDNPEEYERERRENGYLACHMCGYRAKVPDKCPECGKDHFLFMGAGTQKAEDDITSMFPGLRLLRMDYDTTQGKFSHEEILEKFRAGEADVLLGTQMVTKGHDFPRVATVGVLNADSSLMLDDFRAGERTFSMLTQVIGRAGRGDVPGVAVIQTYTPDNEVIRLAAAQDYVSFYNGEIRLRKSLCFPPFCDIAVITLSSADEGYLGHMTTRMSEKIREHIRTDYSDVPMMLYGPFEAPVYRVQNTCRMRFVMKCRLNRRTREFIAELVGEFSRSTPKEFAKSMPSVKSNARITVSADLNPSTV